jgi:hypothetical protein
LAFLSLGGSARTRGTGIGDRDRDGFADVLGIDTLLFGGATPLTRSAPIVGPDGLERVSGRVGIVGDANGDGADDFAIHIASSAILFVYLSGVDAAPLRPSSTLPVASRDGTFFAWFAR